MLSSVFFSDKFASQENRLLSIFGILFAINTLLFISLQTSSLTLLRLTAHNTPFYAGFVFLGIGICGTLSYYNRPTAWRSILRKLLLTTFPAWFFLTYGLIESKNFHVSFQIAHSAYIMLVGLLLVMVAYVHQQTPTRQVPFGFRDWCRNQGGLVLLIVFISTLIFFSFALIRLTRFAAVDEPLWYNGRIGKYWHKIESLDWRRTNISDKPGITVAWATGPGLWFKTPKEYKTIKYEGEAYNANSESIESFYLAFRLPQLLVITFFLPFFYFFLERLFGRNTALFSYAFLATSPILIGMSKIINPDSLLWIFTPLSALAYLLFLKERSFRYLIYSGIFLGLALLTKYVANILFIYFIGLIFLEYLYHRPEQKTFGPFLKRSFVELGILTYAALATFYIFFPAVWIKPEKLITSTLYSQAFEKIAPLFLILLAFILLDQLVNRSRIVNSTVALFYSIRRPLVIGIGSFFLVSLLAVLFVSWNGMFPYNFFELLASPKTISGQSDFIGIFLTNFYPLIFSISPFVLLLLIFAPLALLKHAFLESNDGRITLYFIILILLYYLGATINGVAMIVRYQIILFPIVAFLAGISLSWILKILGQYLKPLKYVSPLVIVIGILAMGIGTLAVTPFPLSYASSLLPHDYHTNVKDMGSGSYEAAQYLNTIPNAEKLLIWTDKDGVCKFFVGRCKRGRNYDALRRDGLDYIVVSSDRKNRTAKMMVSEIFNQKPDLIRFDQYYTKSNPIFELLINGRPSQYVRVYQFGQE